jgi:glycosyltransferase involved in cell wall biosynthesis
MRVLIAAVSSNHSISGVSRHASNLVKSLLARGEISALHLLVAPWEYEYVCEAIARRDARLHVHSVPLREGTLHRNLWYYQNLPEIAKQFRADIVHLAYPSPVQAGVFPCPTVVTLHDLYPYDIPSNFGFPKVIFNRMILKQCLRNVNAIICVSDSTRYRLGVRVPEAMRKAATIPNCLERGPVPVKPPFAVTWGRRPFLLCVAQHRRNKNVLLALRAFRDVVATQETSRDLKLLVVGMSGPESRQLNRFVRASNLSDRVLFVSGIPDAEMSWCYRNCEVLVAPSLVEGFGLPVVEARLAGCRVVCSDIPAFREVGGGGCKYVKLTAAAQEQFTDAILASLREPRPLPAYLPELSPDSIAVQYMAMYEVIRAPSRVAEISSKTGADDSESREGQMLLMEHKARPFSRL